MSKFVEYPDHDDNQFYAKINAKKEAVKAPKKRAEKKDATKPKKTVEKTGEFAVIETGGKQYVVSVGDVLTIEKLQKDASKKAG